MSNHDGGYLLNEALTLLEKNGALKKIGKQKTLQFIRDIDDRATDFYDCNTYEILEGIGERLGICFRCLNYGVNFKYGECEKCQKNE